MNARAQLQITESLAKLQGRGDHFTRQLLQEKQRVSQLETNLKELNEQITEVREDNKKKAIDLLNKHTTTTNSAYQRVDGLDPTRLAEINQKKLVSNLEGRLNKALVRQSSIQSENNAIQIKIDKLRRKVANDSINRKDMEKRLKQVQENVSEIMKRAACVSEQRDKIRDLYNQVGKENMDEREKFNEEYMQLAAYIEEQNLLLETSIAQVASDVVNKLESIDRPFSDATEDDNLSPMEEIKALDARLTDLRKQCEMNRETLKQAEAKNRSYKESFKQLQSVSGLKSTDDIIKAFVRNEEESFSLFNYVQTINQECDKLFYERTKLEEEIAQYEQEQRKQENDRKSIVDGHNTRLADAREEKEKLREANRERKMTVLQIANKVQGIYIKLKCRALEKNATAEEGSNTRGKHMKRVSSDRKITMFAGEQISERNILNHMELIERRAIEIIAEYAVTLDGKNRRIQRRPSVLLVSRFLYALLLFLVTPTTSIVPHENLTFLRPSHSLQNPLTDQSRQPIHKRLKRAMSPAKTKIQMMMGVEMADQCQSMI